MPDDKSRNHQSTRDTERVSYDRLRQVGYSHDRARTEARKVAEQTHRTLDERSRR